MFQKTRGGAFYHMHIRECLEAQRQEYNRISTRSGNRDRLLSPAFISASLEMCLIHFPVFVLASESALLFNDRKHGRSIFQDYTMQSQEPKERLNLSHYPSSNSQKLA